LLRFFVADDRPAVREVIRAYLEGMDLSCRVIGEAADGEAAYGQILALKPDVAILDIEMPRMSGLDVAAQLRAVGNGTPVIFCSGDLIGERQALPSGVIGCLRKPVTLEALRSVLPGAASIDPTAV
jgi:CheY-like chemotaxis protein